MEQLDKTNLTFSGLFTDTQYAIIMEYSAEVGTIMSLLGVLTNIINIRTFISMGLTDGVTVSFLALSIFDFIYLIASLSLGISIGFYVIELKSTIRFQIEPYAVSIFFGSVTILITITNVLTTTFIAAARCMCVAKPLQFKNTFTRTKAIWSMIGFALFAVAIYTPILANMGISSRFDIAINTSRLSLWVSPKRGNIKDIVWIITEMIIPLTTQFIILVCVIIMTTSLRAASKFRHSSTSLSDKGSSKVNKINMLTDKIKDYNESQTNINDKLAGKDLRVVQQVVLISMVYIVCNTPKIIISVVTAIEKEFNMGKAYTQLYLSVNCLRKHFEIFNSAVNLVIYYQYNTKFRENTGF